MLTLEIITFVLSMCVVNVIASRYCKACLTGVHKNVCFSQLFDYASEMG